MKKGLLSAFTIFLCFSAFAQHEAGNVQLRVGALGSLQFIEKETKASWGTTVETDRKLTGAVPIKILYGLGNRLSMGLIYTFGNYKVDSLETHNREGRINITGVSAEIYLVNYESYNLYLNAQYKFSQLRLYKENSTTVIQYRYNGFAPAFYLGSNIMLTEFLGFNMQLGYDLRNLKLKAWHIDDTKQNLSDISDNILSEGINIGIGLCIMF